MKKNILYLIAASLCVMFIAGCDKFLDTKSLTKKDTSNFPMNETDAIQMVNGIYVMMNNNLADPEEDPFFIFDIASDDRLGGGSQSNIGAQGVDRLMNSYIDWMKPLWLCRYAGINRANNALETIDNVTGWSSPSVKEQLLCEIYFFRAWYYFNLAQVFNGVPLVLSTEPVNIPRNTPDEVYAQIASDMKAAIEHGPATRYPEVGDGRVSKWVAEAMMARIWLFYTGFYKKSDLPLAEGGSITKAQVVTWLEDCIQNSGHGLVSDQRNLWPYTNPYTAADYPYAKDNGLKWVGDENIESMFAVKMGNKGDYNGGYGGQIHHNRIVEFYNLRKTVEAAFPFSVQGYSNGPVCEKLWTDWAEDPDYAGDYRRVGSICDRLVEIPNYPGDKAKEVENTNLYAKKYAGVEAWDEKHTSRYLSYAVYYGSENNRQRGLTQSLVWLRFADVLLMHSELTDGKTIYNGKSGMNAVRARVGLPDKAYSVDALRMERKHELAFEGIRYNDMRRYGKAYCLAALKTQLGQPIRNAGGDWITMKDQGAGYEARYNATWGFRPFPASEVLLSAGVLKQNDGWTDAGTAQYTNWK